MSNPITTEELQDLFYFLDECVVLAARSPGAPEMEDDEFFRLVETTIASEIRRDAADLIDTPGHYVKVTKIENTEHTIQVDLSNGKVIIRAVIDPTGDASTISIIPGA